MNMLKATSTPVELGNIRENNPVAELNINQSVHDMQVWEEHRNFADTARSLLRTISTPLEERVHDDALPDSSRGKANTASDYSTLLSEFLSAIDIPRLHGTFANIFYRHKDSLTPDIIGNISGLFGEARKLVDKLTEKLQKAPIAKITPSSGRFQVADDFYDQFTRLGLSVEG